jgi:hypothetical protein
LGVFIPTIPHVSTFDEVQVMVGNETRRNRLGLLQRIAALQMDGRFSKEGF